MSPENRCPQCGGELASDSPLGLCPRCLIRRGLETETAATEPGQAGPPPTPEELAPIFPELEILELVGRGGMGVVYKARQRQLGRLVALKILSPRFAQDSAFAQRFVREARAMAILGHPNIVAVHDFGETGGLYYFLMEFVDGPNLRRLLDAGNLSPQEALAIVPQICDALQYAHDHGVVHRDIKPENILLDKSGRVKIADFGLAKLIGLEAPETSLTRENQVMGTLHYMAPEQTERPQEVDHRADIYSLGVVFYQMLTGELPLGRFAPPSRKVQIDVRLDEVVLRALEKEPELRYQQADEVKSEVVSIVTSPAGPKEGGPVEDTSRRPRVLKAGQALITTPERIATWDGQFFHYRRRGELRLDDQNLFVTEHGMTTTIPLADIRQLSIGHYPRVMNPAGLDFIALTYDDQGTTRRLILSPIEGLIGLPGHFNRLVAEWFEAIQCAAAAATGRQPDTTLSEHFRVRSSSGLLLLFLILAIPAIDMIGCFLAIASPGFSAAAGSNALLPIAAVLGVLAVAVVAHNVLSRIFVANPDRATSPSRPTWKRRIKRMLVVNLPVAVIAALLLQTYVIQTFRATTSAASPEIPQGSWMLVYKLSGHFEPGDIIVYRHADRSIVARVTEPGPHEGVVQVDKRDDLPATVAAADVAGKVIFNTRAQASASPPPKQKTKQPLKKEPKQQPKREAESAPAAASPSLLANGDMELGDGSPTAWEEGAPLPGVEYLWDKSVGHKSSKSLCLNKTANRYFPIAQWYQYVDSPGTTSKLEVSAWVKAERVTKAILDVSFVAADGSETHHWASYIGPKDPNKPPTTHDWTEYTGVVEIPAATKRLGVGLQIYGPGKVHFDDVRARFVAEGTKVTP